MILVHILGGVLAAVGISLFIHDQIRGSKGGASASTVQAWKINLSGPPALILILLGSIVFLFPFTPYWTGGEGGDTSTTTPAITTTTSSAAQTTTFEVVPPPAPIGYQVYPSEVCGGGDAIEWFQEDLENVWGWWIEVGVYDPQSLDWLYTIELDTAEDDLTFGNSAGLCYWDFVDAELPGATYEMWVYAYNDYLSDALVFDYFDGVER